MQSSAQFRDTSVLQHDVSSTARQFNFSHPVYMSESVWKDCVELYDAEGRKSDELTVLQRLRHVLFMASTAHQGELKGPECAFSVHRIPNNGKSSRPEPTTLKIVTSAGFNSRSRVTIKHYSE